MYLKIFSVALSFLLSILLSFSPAFAAPTSEHGATGLTDTSYVSNSEVDVFKRSVMRIECQPGSKPQVAIADADESIMYCCPQGYTVVGQRYIEGWVCCDDELTRGQCINGKHDDFRGGKTPLKCWIDGILTDTVDRDRARGFQVCQALATNPQARSRDDMVDNTHDSQFDDIDLVKSEDPGQLNDIDFEKWCSVHQDPRFCRPHFLHSDENAVNGNEQPSITDKERNDKFNGRDTSFYINYPHHKDCQPPYTDVESEPPAVTVGTHLTRRSHNVICPAGTMPSTVEDSPGLHAIVCCPRDFRKAGWTTKSRIIPTCCTGNKDKPKLEGCPYTDGGLRAESTRPESCPQKFVLQSRCGVDLCLWRSDWQREDLVKCPKV